MSQRAFHHSCRNGPSRETLVRSAAILAACLFASAHAQTTGPATQPGTQQANSLRPIEIDPNRAPEDVRHTPNLNTGPMTGGVATQHSHTEVQSPLTIHPQDVPTPLVPSIPMSRDPGLSGLDSGGSMGGPLLDLSLPKAAPAAPVDTATTTAASQPVEVSKDPLFVQTGEKFRQGDYRGCVTDLRDAVRQGTASAESCELYVAALVATGQVSSASLKAKEAAQQYPKTFFSSARYLAALCQDQPDFHNHFETVRKRAGTATTLDPGLLWALYQQLEGSSENDPYVTLTLLHPAASEQRWFIQLAASLKNQKK